MSDEVADHFMRPSLPRRSRRAPGRWRQRRRSWCSFELRDGGSGQEAQLSAPGPSDHLRCEALLALGDLSPDVGAVLVGPGGLDELGPKVRVAGLGEVTPVMLPPLEYSEGTDRQSP